MKRILFTVCMLLGCVLFTMAQEDSYKIEGKLANTVNGKLLLVANTDKGMLDIGEATVTNGVFEFTGRMPELTLVYLMPCWLLSCWKTPTTRSRWAQTN